MSVYELNNGVMYRVRKDAVDNAGDILGALTENFISYTGELFDGVHHGVKNSNGTIQHLFVKEASHLRMSTKFGIRTGEGRRLEHFIDYHGGVRGVVDWVVPMDYRMFFCLETGGASYPFHLLFVNPKKEFVMIPMSNCYDAGGVCHGNIPVPSNNELNIADKFKAAMDMFWNSEWSNHLIEYAKFVNHNKKIFRWDIKMKQLPMIDPEVNLPTMNPNFSGSSLVSEVMNRRKKLTYNKSTDEKAGEATIEKIVVPAPAEVADD